MPVPWDANLSALSKLPPSSFARESSARTLACIAHSLGGELLLVLCQGTFLFGQLTCVIRQLLFVAADAVVVVWTQGSVVSDWVYAEATRAAHQGTLVPVRDKDLDPKSIPLPFYSVFHTCLANDTRAVLDAIDKRL